MTRIPLLIALALPLVGCARTEPAGRPAPEPLSLADARAGKRHLVADPDAKVTAVVFVGHDCPISNGYAPEVLRLCADYAGRATFYVVYADAELSDAAAAKHAGEYGYPCPALIDPEMRLARKVGATVKPEAVLLSPSGEVLYRGAIDDVYVDFGKKRPTATKRHLRDALEAVLSDRPVPTPRIAAIGCDIFFPDDEP